MIELTDCWICPSNEDDMTFTVQTGTGEIFRFRGKKKSTNIFDLFNQMNIQQVMPKDDKNGLINYEHVQEAMLLMLYTCQLFPSMNYFNVLFFQTVVRTMLINQNPTTNK